VNLGLFVGYRNATALFGLAADLGYHTVGYNTQLYPEAVEQVFLAGEPVGMTTDHSLSGPPHVCQVFPDELDDGIAHAAIGANVGVKFPAFALYQFQPLGFGLASRPVFGKVPLVPSGYHFPEYGQVRRWRPYYGHLNIETVVVAGVTFHRSEPAATAQSSDHDIVDV